MSGSEPSSAANSPAGKHGRELDLIRQQISADGNIERQLRVGGEPGLVGATGIDDETLMRWLRAEK